jgi:hypothetical protein
MTKHELAKLFGDWEARHGLLVARREYRHWTERLDLHYRDGSSAYLVDVGDAHGGWVVVKDPDDRPALTYDRPDRDPDASSDRFNTRRRTGS